MFNPPATILSACLHLATAAASQKPGDLPSNRHAVSIRHIRAKPYPDAATRDAALVFEAVARSAFASSQDREFLDLAFRASGSSHQGLARDFLQTRRSGLHLQLVPWLRRAGMEIVPAPSATGLLRLSAGTHEPPDPAALGRALSSVLTAGDRVASPSEQAKLCTAVLCSVQPPARATAFAAMVAATSAAPMAVFGLIAAVAADARSPLSPAGHRHDPCEVAWLTAGFHLRMPGMVHAAIAASSAWADEVALRTLPVGLRQSLLTWTAAEAEEFLARMPSVVAAVAAFNDRRDLAREDWTRIKFLAADSTTWKHEAIALAEARLSQLRLATHPSAPARQRRLA